MKMLQNGHSLNIKEMKTETLDPGLGRHQNVMDPWPIRQPSTKLCANPSAVFA